MRQKMHLSPSIHPSQTAPAEPDASQTLMRLALDTWASGETNAALTLLRRAVTKDFRRPEPWFWIGRIQEESADLRGAAFSYFMAHDLACYGPAEAALRRLGYLDQEP